MTAALAPNQSPPPVTSRHSQRLAELRSAAADIRRRHTEGQLTAQEAAHELEQLAKRHMTILDKILAYY